MTKYDVMLKGLDYSIPLSLDVLADLLCKNKVREYFVHDSTFCNQIRVSNQVKYKDANIVLLSSNTLKKVLCAFSNYAKKYITSKYDYDFTEIIGKEYITEVSE